MRKHTGDLVFAAALTALGIAMAVGAGSYRILGEGGRIAPGFTPLIAGIALTGFAGWAFVETWTKRRRATAQSANEAASTDVTTSDAEPGDGHPATQRRVVVVFALMLATIVLTVLTGFLAAFGLLILTLLWLVEKEKLWVALTVSVTATFAAWGVFVLLLQIPLPGGIIGLFGSL